MAYRSQNEIDDAWKRHRRRELVGLLLLLGVPWIAAVCVIVFVIA